MQEVPISNFCYLSRSPGGFLEKCLFPFSFFFLLLAVDKRHRRPCHLHPASLLASARIRPSRRRRALLPLSLSLATPLSLSLENERDRTLASLPPPLAAVLDRPRRIEGHHEVHRDLLFLPLQPRLPGRLQLGELRRRRPPSAAVAVDGIIAVQLPRASPSSPPSPW